MSLFNIIDFNRLNNKYMNNENKDRYTPPTTTASTAPTPPTSTAPIPPTSTASTAPTTTQPS